MADENPESPPSLPEKPWYLSNSVWAAILSVVAGLLAQNDKFADVAAFLNANANDLVGWIMTAIGFYALWGATTRTTVLTKGK